MGPYCFIHVFRFSTIFNHDTDSMPRVWTGAEDIRAITKDARSTSLKLLSVMATTRLDEKPDKIENVLFSSLMDGTIALPSSQNRSIGDYVDPLASSSWDEEAHKRNNNWLPPPWAIMAMVVLGFNEFMLLLSLCLKVKKLNARLETPSRGLRKVGEAVGRYTM